MRVNLIFNYVFLNFCFNFQQAHASAMLRSRRHRVRGDELLDPVVIRGLARRRALVRRREAPLS